MKKFFRNWGYFFKEAKTIISLNLLSNIISLLSTGLIFFILAMVISGWWISNQIIETIKGEAEISVYYDVNNDGITPSHLVDIIQGIGGVRDAKIVKEEEAYNRMVEILGKDASVLEHFDDNPFNPFIEVKIHLQDIDTVLLQLNSLSGIDYIRDNREILEKLHSISEVLRILGYLIVIAVGISTVVIISHIIRLGIYNNREQLNTLRLLGAPESFIGFPYLLTGFLLTLSGGILGAILATYVINVVYLQMVGPLPFIPLPPRDTLIIDLIILVTCLSGMLGFLGSLFGLSSAKIK